MVGIRHCGELRHGRDHCKTLRPIGSTESLDNAGKPVRTIAAILSDALCDRVTPLARHVQTIVANLLRQKNQHIQQRLAPLRRWFAPSARP